VAGASPPAQPKQLPHLLREFGTQALVVEVQDERVDDGARDGRRYGRRLHACPGVGGTAHQHPVHAHHHAPEGRVALEEAQHDRVALEDTRHATLLDGEVDHLGDQERARSHAGSLGFRCRHGRLQAREHDLGDGEDDLVLRVVLMIDGRLRHAERVGDHLQRGAADAVLGE